MNVAHAGRGGGTAPRTPPLRRGFLLIDLLMALVVIAILVTVALPALRPNDSLKLISAATVLAADLEFTQASTLNEPQDPFIVRVDDAAARYWIARQSDPEVPITKPDGSPYEVELGTAESFPDIGLRLEGGKDGAIVFDAFGRLADGANAQIVLTSPTGELPVRVLASTGSVYIGE